MKRIVRLKNKETGEIASYPTLAQLIRRNGENAVGIGLNALYNAMCLNHGKWENKQYQIYYDNIDLGKREWN